MRHRPPPDHATECRPPVGLVAPRLPVGSSPSDEGDDDVRGVAVEVLAASVVDRGRPRVGVPGGDLHISEWDACVKGSHDERRSEHVRVDVSEAGPLADRADLQASQRRHVVEVECVLEYPGRPEVRVLRHSRPAMNNCCRDSATGACWCC